VRVDLGIAAGDPMPLVLKVRSGAPPYTWFVNGLPVGSAEFGGALSWQPDGPGFVDLMVIDARGRLPPPKCFSSDPSRRAQ
jgi:penicillin-binding protein 1C